MPKINLTSENETQFRVLWDEMQSLYAARFRWGEKLEPSDFTSSTASSIQTPYPPDEILSAPCLLREVSSVTYRLLIHSLISKPFRMDSLVFEVTTSG